MIHSRKHREYNSSTILWRRVKTVMRGKLILREAFQNEKEANTEKWMIWMDGFLYRSKQRIGNNFTAKSYFIKLKLIWSI